MADQDTEWRPGHELSFWPDLKLARAHQHIADLQSRVMVWSKSTTAKTKKIISDDQLTLDVVLDMPTRPPTVEMSLSLGDALHNARASLDALTWDLAHQDGAEPERPTRIQFPICRDAENQWPAVERDLATVPPEALARIRSVQPFLVDDPQSSALGYLHDLDIRDKHRASLECVFQVREFSLNEAVISFVNPAEIPDPPFSLEFVHDGVLNDGDVILRLTSSARMKAAKVPAAMSWHTVITLDGKRLELASILKAIMQSVEWTHEVVRYGVKGATKRAEWMAKHGRPEAPPPAPSDDNPFPEQSEIVWDVAVPGEQP